MRWSLLSLALMVCLLGSAARAGETKVRALIVDGQNNHDWRTTTPILKQALEKTGRFTVAVSSNLKSGDKPGKIETTVPFPPDLSQVDVLVSNYNGAPWPMQFNQALEAALKEDKLGLVIVHAANNAFPAWNEYNLMIGMGWRSAKQGQRLYLDEQGKPVRVPAGDGLNSGHRTTGKYLITVRNAEHPITRGMPAEWLHNNDELYDHMRGPIENIDLLASAFSKGTMVHEPMIWTVRYGKGRVFHTPMGHAADSMRCVGFQATVSRGAEWAATGQVTLPLPDNFPTAKEVSVAP